MLQVHYRIQQTTASSLNCSLKLIPKHVTVLSLFINIKLCRDISYYEFYTIFLVFIWMFSQVRQNCLCSEHFHNRCTECQKTSITCHQLNVTSQGLDGCFVENDWNCFHKEHHTHLVYLYEVPVSVMCTLKRPHHELSQYDTVKTKLCSRGISGFPRLRLRFSATKWSIVIT